MRLLSRLLSYKNWVQVIVEHPYKIISLMMLITFFFCLHLPNLHFRNSIYDLVIEDLPETSEYQAFKQEFGNQEMILVVIKSENIFDPQTFRKIDGLAKAFLKIEGVRRVISLPGIKREMDVTDKWSNPLVVSSFPHRAKMVSSIFVGADTPTSFHTNTANSAIPHS